MVGAYRADPRQGGSAVGLGSIWKFPCEVGENGGAGDAMPSIRRLAEAAGEAAGWR